MFLFSIGHTPVHYSLMAADRLFRYALPLQPDGASSFQQCIGSVCALIVIGLQLNQFAILSRAVAATWPNNISTIMLFWQLLADCMKPFCPTFLQVSAAKAQGRRSYLLQEPLLW